MTARTVGRCQAWHDITALGQHTRSTTSGVAYHNHLWAEHTVERRQACQHRLWDAHTVERCWTWHDIIAFGQHTRSNDFGRDMPSPPLDWTHGQMTSGAACHHHSRVAETVGKRRTWHAFIALDGKYDRTTSGVACNHRLSVAHMVERSQAWHDITAFGQHTRLNDVGCGMPSLPLGSTHGRKTSTWHAVIALGRQTRSNDVGRRMQSWPLDSTYGRTTFGVACHHSPWTENTFE